jgi:hypothetical protein
MMDTMAMPTIIADLTLYMIKSAVMMPPQKMPIQTCDEDVSSQSRAGVLIYRVGIGMGRCFNKIPNVLRAYRWILELMALADAELVLVFGRAAGKVERSALRAADDAEARRRGQADQREEQADAGCAGDLKRRRDDGHEPLAHADQ